MDNRKVILYGSGEIGKQALNWFGFINVYAFADANKHGQIYYNKKVISPEELVEIQEGYDIVVSVGYHILEDVFAYLDAIGVKKYNYFYNLQCADDFDSNPKLARLAGKYKGGECFIIGNGSSLRAEDLNMIYKNHIPSFACNRIYKFFDQTLWRPDFYVCAAEDILSADLETIVALDVPFKFIADDDAITHVRTDERLPEHLRGIPCYFKYIRNNKADVFSGDCSKAIYGKATTVSIMIQLSVYMGFTSIYLSGVDNDMFDGAPKDVKHFTDEYINYEEHFFKDYKYSEKKRAANKQRTDDFYRYANTYTSLRGVKIYNATRGGRLDAFERVDFDSLIKDKG